MFALSKFIVFVAVQFSIVQTTNGATCDSAISISRNCGTGGCDVITFRNEEIQHALAEVSDDLSDAFETRCKIYNDRGNLSLVPRDCMDIQKLGYRKTGFYTIYPLRSTPFKVRCDIVTWTQAVVDGLLYRDEGHTVTSTNHGKNTKSDLGI